jgi:hypothetical protein
MPTWFEDIAGPGYAGAVMWTLVALVALGVIMLIIKIVRKVSGGSFASAGSYRSRLAVMDAAEVDTQRRLVLVRRDEVEHLIMIGGPTDIVIEQNITGPGRSAARPVAEAPITTAPLAERQGEPTRTEPPVAASPAIHREPSPVPARRVAEEPRVERRQPVAPAASAAGAPRVEPRSEPAIAERVAASEPTVDEAMVSEFERDFQSTEAAQRREPTIEDEMDRLLNEAPRERR